MIENGFNFFWSVGFKEENGVSVVVVGVKKYGNRTMKENGITEDAVGRQCLTINHRLGDLQL